MVAEKEMPNEIPRMVSALRDFDVPLSVNALNKEEIETPSQMVLHSMLNM